MKFQNMGILRSFVFPHLKSFTLIIENHKASFKPNIDSLHLASLDILFYFNFIYMSLSISKQEGSISSQFIPAWALSLFLGLPT